MPPTPSTGRRFCIGCGGFLSSQGLRCRPCQARYSRDLKDRPKAEVLRSSIQAHARRVVAGRKRTCAMCGYSLSVQAAHVKPVREFPPDATVGEINHPENLVLLCPRCHWEVDNLPFV